VQKGGNKGLINTTILLVILGLVLLLAVAIKKNKRSINLNRNYTYSLPESNYFEKWQQEQEYKKAHTKVLRFNWVNGKLEYAYPGQVLRYSPWFDDWEWVYPDEIPH